jgi:hypothetical protein
LVSRGERLSINLKPFACLALTCALSLCSVGQQNAQPQDSDASGQSPPQVSPNAVPTAQTQQKSNSDKEKSKSVQEIPEGKVAGTSNDRLFYAMPNFLTLQGREKLPPMSAKDKFKVVALATFDYFEYPWWGALSAISQAENSEPAFGQGGAAYGKRYGAQAADSTIENFMVGAVFASALHQDPRFYQSGHGGFFTRTGYGVSRIFVTRGDNGKTQFNASEVFGSAAAAAISTYSYHPKSTYLSTPTNPHLFAASDRTLRNAADVWATQVSLDTVTIVVKEFWPDIRKKMSHKQKPAPTHEVALEVSKGTVGEFNFAN